MPLIQPKMNVFPISHLKPQKYFSRIPQFHNLFPIPRTILRNPNTPKTLSFQQILLHSRHPNGTRSSKQTSNKTKHGSLIPKINPLQPQTTLLLRETNLSPRKFGLGSLQYSFFTIRGKKPSKKKKGKKFKIKG
jgi:hypothetical protein